MPDTRTNGARRDHSPTGTAAAAVLARYPEVIAVSDLADVGRVQSWGLRAGAGEVLSGAIGALLAGGREPGWAAAAAARAHAMAAELAAYDAGGGGRGAAPISAIPLLHHLPRAIATLRSLPG